MKSAPMHNVQVTSEGLMSLPEAMTLMWSLSPYFCNFSTGGGRLSGHGINEGHGRGVGAAFGSIQGDEVRRVRQAFSPDQGE